MAKLQTQEKTITEVEAIEDAIAPLPIDIPKATPVEDATPKISLSDIRAALIGATDADKKSFAEAVGLSPAVGKPRSGRKRVTQEEVKNMALATGGATHPEDYLPNPPEHIAEKGETAVAVWHQQWLDGKTINWDRMGDSELAEMIATAQM